MSRVWEMTGEHIPSPHGHRARSLQRRCGCGRCARCRQHGGANHARAEGESFFGNLVSAVRQRLDDVDGSRIVDLTTKADKSKRKGTRDAKSVYALVLHQMSCCAVRRDPLTSYLGTGAHFAIMRDGTILQLHPVTALVWASNGFNARSVAVEFAGNFPDINGRWRLGDTYGRDHVTPAQVEAGRYLLRWLKKSMGLTHVLAHRQSSGTRDNDPGPDIWYYVGQWGVDNLGLKDGGAGFKIDSGSAIPDQWRKWNKPLAAPATKKELESDFELEDGELAPRSDETDNAREARGTEAGRRLQTGLNLVLHLRLPLTGIVDAPTRSALRRFQAREGLRVDGIAGPEVARALMNAAPLSSRSGMPDGSATQTPDAPVGDFGDDFPPEPEARW